MEWGVVVALGGSRSERHRLHGLDIRVSQPMCHEYVGEECCRAEQVKLLFFDFLTKAGD